MKEKIREYIVRNEDLAITALERIDKNKQGFVIVVNEIEKVLGVLTDGDIRRGLIKGIKICATVDDFYTKNAVVVRITDGFEVVTELFKNQAIKFLPIIDDNGSLINIITKSQMHTLLLQDIHSDLFYDFFSLDTGVMDYEIYQRPWGFYKTVVLNDYYQGKIISVKPGGQLSLQLHNHREEHWIVVHGTGIAQVGESFVDACCGRSIFIPKGCKHRLINTDDKENFIIIEAQIGDYLSEDDIIRYKDVYGRV